MHVGCNVFEIQCQKEEQQSFQETAKVSKSVMLSFRLRGLLVGVSYKLPLVCAGNLRVRMSAADCCTGTEAVLQAAH
jgi:hypothetical protein